jgi:hypothetical protein
MTVLTCGHTVCTPCATKLHVDRTVCPNCAILIRHKIQIRKFEKLIKTEEEKESFYKSLKRKTKSLTKKTKSNAEKI